MPMLLSALKTLVITVAVGMELRQREQLVVLSPAPAPAVASAADASPAAPAAGPPPVIPSALPGSAPAASPAGAVVTESEAVMEPAAASMAPDSMAVTPAAPAAGAVVPTLEPVAAAMQSMDDMVTAEREALDPKDPLALLKGELAAQDWLEDQLTEKLTDMKEEVYRGKIALDEKAVAKETTPGMASMLGDMRREMHSLAAPFYSKVLRGQIVEVQQREKELLAEIERRENNATVAAPVPRSFSQRATLPILVLAASALAFISA